ncbi:helix-turn-helix domain-containing protein [Sphingobacterium daejeonense]|uniref:helix-turn-helix domain-containing protein n=1 Tax=Sphingobacterium daejeonense TaxID=371142 RepID=UPI0021A5C8D8|nr:helix-turn-helix domain-containing protein [Sphingobacterium daejeonense]MCT1531352.1 helix-turn-helix domain-containing protein [Sphingobacterium daejeonense]
MAAPYTVYPENKHNKNASKHFGDLSERHRYPLPFAQVKPHYKDPDAELFSQQLDDEPFFIDLVEIEVQESTYIPFDIHDKRIYLYFMLKGSLLYTTDTKKRIIKTQPNTFLMSYYDTGRYYAHAEPGEYIAFVVSMDTEWIETKHQKCQNLQYILDRFKKGHLSYETMNLCRMDRKVQRWLYKIYSYSKDNAGAVDGNLRKYVSLLIEYYDNVLEDQWGDIAFKVKDFIDANCCDIRLNVKYIANHFHLTTRTLLNIFKARYHVSVQQYYTELRIEYALRLMKQKGIGIRDVYMEVGYTDERAFRYALERYRNRNK